MPEKLLYILRHAKAEIAEGYASDHERPLSPRGLADADAMGKHLHAQGKQPEHVLCSTARRTRETHAQLALDIPVAFSEKLYLASASELMAMIQSIPDSTSSALVIGHNPGMHELVAILADHAKHEADAEALREKFPTCALAVLRFKGSWAKLHPGTATLEALTFPKQLA